MNVWYKYGYLNIPVVVVFLRDFIRDNRVQYFKMFVIKFEVLICFNFTILTSLGMILFFSRGRPADVENKIDRR